MYVYLATVGYELQAKKKVDPLHHRFNKKAVNELLYSYFQVDAKSTILKKNNCILSLWKDRLVNGN